MILSKVYLAPGKLENAWEWHRALWTLFPGIVRETNDSAPFLYRIESMSLKAGAELLVLSDREPEPRSERAVVRAKKIFDPVLREGLRLGFILTANVTKTIRDRDQPERKIRVPLIHEDEQVAWLRRKLEGVHLQSVRVQPHRPIYFRKGARPGKIVSTTFQGVIEVQQPEKLAELLRKGIGPAKAFGCGLMLVRPD